MELVVMGDRVVVERDGVREQSEAGIVLAPSAQDVPTTGVVVGVGGGVASLAVGDRVVFAGWSGTEYLADGKTYFVLRESEIVGVLKETV